LAVTQVSKVKVNITIDIAMYNVMIMCVSKWLYHCSHAGRKYVIAVLSHALQHGHLLFFVATIRLKMVEIYSAHGHPTWINLCGATTTQAYSYNAHAKYLGETLHGYVHNLDPFPLCVEAHEPEILTKQ
jgi:hypothetical protein